MCELFGLSSMHPVSVRFFRKSFFDKEKDVEGGWGLGFYSSGGAVVFKEPIASSKSPLVNFIQNYSMINGTIFMVHARKDTVGVSKYSNTHPFVRELFGKEWMFCHKGTIHKDKIPDSSRFIPVGSTDSEKFFCYVLDLLSKNKNKKAGEIIEQAVEKSSYVSEGTFFLSDGESFWVRSSTSSNKLYSLEYSPSHSIWEKRFGSKSLEMELSKNHEHRIALFSSEPLSKDEWKLLPANKVLCFRDGKRV